MELSAVEALGLIAGACTTVAFVPQVVKTWKSRSVADISLSMFSIFTVGVCLWLAYGLLLGSPALIASNVITLVLSTSILAMKLLWGRG
ncbi:SemiSWEET transporter [Zavarzinia sp. CC-PAN008]|uniref:SemiSWEET transporter n=1 Tax=Zavarzinia sp. CC-PAN008 TaxID=3243332 RepID=UPI003F7482AF